MKCKDLMKKNKCKYFKGKSNINATWSAYDGKTIEDLKLTKLFTDKELKRIGNYLEY